MRLFSYSFAAAVSLLLFVAPDATAQTANDGVCPPIAVYSGSAAVEISGPTTVCPEGSVPGDPGCVNVDTGSCNAWPWSKRKVIHTCPGGAQVFKSGDCALCVTEKGGTRKAGEDCCNATTEEGKSPRDLCIGKVRIAADRAGKDLTPFVEAIE